MWEITDNLMKNIKPLIRTLLWTGKWSISTAFIADLWQHEANRQKLYLLFQITWFCRLHFCTYTFSCRLNMQIQMYAPGGNQMNIQNIEWICRLLTPHCSLLANVVREHYVSKCTLCKPIHIAYGWIVQNILYRMS